MSVYIGDFLGFTLGNLHSSQLNITRVTNGDRYTETLTPNFTDSTAVIPGGNGTYYWNTSHTQKNFTIDFAFDDLREEDIRRLKQHFSFNGVKELIFDEAPYKKYYVKCSAPPTLRYIPFSDLGDVINYKGEGSVNLVAYYPYGISTKEYQIGEKREEKIYNLGDLEIPLQIFYPINSAPKTIYTALYNDNEEEIGSLALNSVVKLPNSNDAYICIDMKTHLIEGLDASYNKTGNLYNKYIESGDFFLVPLEGGTLKVTGSSITSPKWSQVKFHYLYY